MKILIFILLCMCCISCGTYTPVNSTGSSVGCLSNANTGYTVKAKPSKKLRKQARAIKRRQGYVRWY